MPVIVNVVLNRKKEELILGDVGDINLSGGDKVIVDIDQAQELGTVSGKERLIEKTKEPVYKISRKFSDEDLPRIEDNKRKASEAVKIILQKVERHELQMNLTCVEYSFDRSKLFIYYTAETRVDFRELIKDLGHLLKTRIQMVQIGVRDEAKMLGGLGPCGRVLCCSSFLKNFITVSVDTAKLQDPSMNMSKMCGLCGRLMCCLAYEGRFYEEQSKKFPKVNSKVHTPDGAGTVISINYLNEDITVELSDKQVHKFKPCQLTVTLLDKILT
ncbi:MAG: regulatory iron-sulfur-containing complex subunit RicT [Elusimicrobiota bacterium]